MLQAGDDSYRLIVNVERAGLYLVYLSVIEGIVDGQDIVLAEGIKL